MSRILITLLAVLLTSPASAVPSSATPPAHPAGPPAQTTGVAAQLDAKRDLVLVRRSDRPPSGDAWVAVRRDHPVVGLPDAVTAVVANTEHRLHGDPEPLFADQWALENSGQIGGTPGADIDAVRAWGFTLGDPSVVVAVLDSGADVFHPDLAGRVVTNGDEIEWNGVDDDGNGYVDDRWGYDFFDGDADVSDDNGHGTFIAGVVAAGLNAEGIAGLAPEVQVLVVRVCGSGLCFTSDVVAGIDYAIARGADVINMSFGSDSPNAALEDAVARAAAAGIVVVASAGNDGHDNDTTSDGPPVYPASYPAASIISVTSTDRLDRIPTDSFGDYAVNYGSASVDLGAPGDDILSLYPGGGYASGSGTSFAAPHVAATAALMRSVRPGLGPVDLANRLRSAVEPLDPLDGITATGGRLNAYRAVGAALLGDVVDSAFFDDVLWLYGSGVTRGCNPPDNDEYCPDRTVTRGEMAAFLGRTLDLPSAALDHFDDDTGSVFEHDINRLFEAGITQGCNPPDNDRFCPDRTVTRGEMAAFLVRAFGYDDPGGGDWFVDDDLSIFEGVIDRLRAAGVTKGCNPPDNDRFCPDAGVTRGQMAAFLRRAAE